MEKKKNEHLNLESRKRSFFLFGLLCSLGLVLSAFEWATASLIHNDAKFTNAEAFIEVEKIIEVELEKPKPQPKALAPKHETEIDNLDNPIEKIPDSTLDILVDVKIDNALKTFNAPITFDNEDNGKDEPEIDDNAPPTWVEEMPEFAGGRKKLYTFLGKTIKYPERERQLGIEEKIFVQFVVEKDGSISDAKIVRGENSGLAKEALRAVNKMPNWKPGKQGGKKVRVKFTLPIDFVLNK